MDDEWEECRSCHGTGERLARLTPEQDMGFARRGFAIPKVTCWVCDGIGDRPVKAAAGQSVKVRV